MLFTVPSMANEVAVQKLLTAVSTEEWLREDVFQLKWWLLLGLILFISVAWWRMLDKARLPETVLYAVLTTVLAMGIMEYGDELTLWDYPCDILPIFRVLTAVNLLLLPLVYSLIFQHFRTWRRFTIATLAATCVLSFVLEPALAWADYFQMLKWKYYYTFPVYIAVALFMRWAVLKIAAITEKARSDS
jgi:hypothetical protein